MYKTDRNEAKRLEETTIAMAKFEGQYTYV
jgi:hypothetical protein